MITIPTGRFCNSLSECIAICASRQRKYIDSVSNTKVPWFLVLYLLLATMVAPASAETLYYDNSAVGILVGGLDGAPDENMFYPAGAYLRDAALFSCAGTADTSSDAITCHWLFDDDGSSQISSPGEWIQHKFIATGNQLVEMFACPSSAPQVNNDYCTQYDAIVSVYNISPDPYAVNPGMIASLPGPYNSTVGTQVHFHVKVTNGNYQQDAGHTYEWKIYTGATPSANTLIKDIDTSNTSHSDLAYTFSTDGRYTVTVHVHKTLCGGYLEELCPPDVMSEAAVEISPKPSTIPTPIPVAIINGQGPTNATAGVPVSFSATDSYDPSGNPITYTWRFGDENGQIDPSHNAQVTHVFGSPGSYSVTLWVNNGTDDSIPVNIHVQVAQSPNPLGWLPAVLNEVLSN